MERRCPRYQSLVHRTTLDAAQRVHVSDTYLAFCFHGLFQEGNIELKIYFLGVQIQVIPSIYLRNNIESHDFPGSSVAKTLPAMQETQVRFLGQEDPREEDMATQSSILAEKSHGQGSLVGYNPWGCKESDTT